MPCLVEWTRLILPGEAPEAVRRLVRARATLHPEPLSNLADHAPHCAMAQALRCQRRENDAVLDARLLGGAVLQNVERSLGALDNVCVDLRLLNLLL